MTKLGLTLNEAKTSVRDARQECFDFLGYAFGPHHDERGGERYLGASPSKKSVRRIKSTVSELLVAREKGSWPNVRDRLNRLCRVGRRTSAMGPARGSIGRLITTFVIASGTSCAIGASCTGVAHGVFTLLWFSGRSVFYSFDACSFSHRRGPYDEAGRKAGCRKSARPV